MDIFKFDLGLPSDPNPPIPYGIPTGYQDQMPQPAISSTQSWWDSWVSTEGQLEEWVSEGTKTIYNGTGKVIKDVAGGTADVLSTVAKPVEDIATFGIVQIVIVIGVIAVGLYFIGKTGAFKVDLIV